jgi:hypothetical protein
MTAPRAEKLTARVAARAPARGSRCGIGKSQAHGCARPRVRRRDRASRPQSLAGRRRTRSPAPRSTPSRRRRERDARCLDRFVRRKTDRYGRFRSPEADRGSRRRPPSMRRSAPGFAPSARSERSEEISISAAASMKPPARLFIFFRELPVEANPTQTRIPSQTFAAGRLCLTDFRLRTGRRSKTGQLFSQINEIICRCGRFYATKNSCLRQSPWLKKGATLTNACRCV